VRRQPKRRIAMSDELAKKYRARMPTRVACPRCGGTECWDAEGETAGCPWCKLEAVEGERDSLLEQRDAARKWAARLYVACGQAQLANGASLKAAETMARFEEDEAGPIIMERLDSDIVDLADLDETRKKSEQWFACYNKYRNRAEAVERERDSLREANRRMCDDAWEWCRLIDDSCQPFELGDKIRALAAAQPNAEPPEPVCHHGRKVGAMCPHCMRVVEPPTVATPEPTDTDEDDE